MGLSWQQGPIGSGPVGRFLVAEPLPERLVFAERLRRRMRVRFGGEWIADSEDVIARTDRPQVLFESGFGPRWYVPREDIRQIELTPVEGETFCPYKGLASYYDIGEAKRAAWVYPEAYDEVGRVSGWVSFEPEQVEVYLDGERLHLEPGQTVRPHGVDRGLDSTEVLETRRQRGS